MIGYGTPLLGAVVGTAVRRARRGNGHQHRVGHRRGESEAGCGRGAGGLGSAREAVRRATGVPARGVDRRRREAAAGAVGLPPHRGLAHPGDLRPVGGVLREGARRAGRGHPRDRLGQPDDRPAAGHLFRERVQGDRPHDHRVPPRGPDGFRDRRRELEMHPARTGPGHRAADDRRLRPLGRVRRRHRLVPRPAGAAPRLLGGGDRRGGAGGEDGGPHRRALLGLRQERHDPRPAEGLYAGRDPARAVRRGGAQLQVQHRQGPYGEAAGGFRGGRLAEPGGGARRARGLRAPARRPLRPPRLRLVRGHRRGDARSAGDEEAQLQGHPPTPPARVGETPAGGEHAAVDGERRSAARAHQAL